VEVEGSCDPISNNGCVQRHIPVIPDTQRSTNRRFGVQAGLGMKQDPVSKINNAKWMEGVEGVA
jgi:hypothetical protein